MSTKHTTPTLGEEAKIGVVGEFLDIYRDKVEPSDAALLFHFLVIAGNILGPNLYMSASKGKHPGRLFLVNVARSSGAKGAAKDIVIHFFSNVVPEYISKNKTSGFSSGEGVIKSVADKQIITKEVKGEMKNIVIDEGVTDKRKLYIETEFSKVLTVMRKEGSTLSYIVRQAWDDGDLSVNTIQRYASTGAHISIIGHVTPEELQLTLTEADRMNGFANRFLWIYTEKAKLVPFAIEIDEQRLSSLQHRMADILNNAPVGEVTFSEEAKPFYVDLYGEGDKPGLLNLPSRIGIASNLLSRGPANILRMSVIYAALAGKKVVELEHLKAAYACHRYVEDSVKMLFGSDFGNYLSDRIWQELQDIYPRGMTKTGIWEMFNRNPLKKDLDRAIETIVSTGLAQWVTEESLFSKEVNRYLVKTV